MQIFESYNAMNVSAKKILLLGLILSVASSELAVAAEAPSGSKWKKYLAAATVGVAAVGATAFLIKKSAQQSLYKECKYENHFVPDSGALQELQIHCMSGDTIRVSEGRGRTNMSVDVVIRAHCQKSLDSVHIGYEPQGNKYIVRTQSKKDSTVLSRGLFGLLFRSGYSATPTVEYTITTPYAYIVDMNTNSFTKILVRR